MIKNTTKHLAPFSPPQKKRNQHHETTPHSIKPCLFDCSIFTRIIFWLSIKKLFYIYNRDLCDEALCDSSRWKLYKYSLCLHHLNLQKKCKSFILYLICWPSACFFPTWRICWSLWKEKLFLTHKNHLCIMLLIVVCLACLFIIGPVTVIGDTLCFLFPDLLIFFGMCIWKGISFSISRWSSTTELLSSD